ncbi:MAG TPA: protein kinase, partial [Myxococcales bacterium]|nr:protein kinase [Myxococcales bacterium]
MHPPDDTIAALLEGRLPPREAASVHAHAADCDECRQIIAEGARARSAIVRPPTRSTRRPPESSEDATESSPMVDEDEYWDVKTQGPLPRGFSVGRYTILEHLASGGMGSVYAAYDPDLDRRVALKVIATTSRIGADDLRWRLLREAQAMARLNHPNVAVVHEVGTLSGQVFLAMEYVEGSTLREWLNQRQRTWQEILQHFIQAGRGLAAAHARGLVHRDFKPDNVLLGEDGRARVVDFGLVRPREDALGNVRAPTLSTPLTEVGTLLGTPRYMAPEQMRGKTPDGRADQFSFCVALYEAIYRVRPFGGETLHERLAQIDRGAFSPPPPGHGVPERIGAAVRRGLNPEPARRFSSMDGLLEALEGVLQPRRGWRVALVASVAGAAAVVGTGLWVVAQRLDRCMSADTRLQRAWGPAQRSAVPPSWAPGSAVLDSYSARWRVAVTQACDAPRPRGQAAERQLTGRLECLDRALGELQGAGAALVRAEPGALARTWALPDPTSCLENAAAATPAPEEAWKTRTLQRLGELQARLDTGAAPLNELKALVDEAQPLPFVQSQALLLLGRAEARAHPREPFAEDAFHRAATAA